MTVEALLVGPTGHGGEEVYVRTLRENPPADVRYRSAGSFHEGADGVRCTVAAEILLNRVVHPLAIPDMGFRAFRLETALDLIHVHAHPLRLRGARGVPVVMSEGSSLAVYLGEYCGWSESRIERRVRRSRRLYRRLGIYDRLLAQDLAARVYVFSDWAREVNLRWGADSEKTGVLYPGFPTPALPARPEHDEFRFLFAGTSFERKGGFELIEAFAALAAERPEAMLTIVAPDPTAPPEDRMQRSWVSAERRRQALGRLSELERVGRIERIDLMDHARLLGDHFATADAFVMPAHAEGFGFTNVEAMSYGMPVVSSTAGPIPEVVDHGHTGLLVTPGDIDGLAAAMSSMLSNRDRTRAMGVAARSAFLERFTSAGFRERLGRLYAEVLSS